MANIKMSIHRAAPLSVLLKGDPLHSNADYAASKIQIVAINLRQVGENLLLELALKAVSAASLKAILSLGSRIEASGN